MVKVTVLMPTYNVAPYVKEAVESVLTQTYRDFLLLVIDDCSTDATVEAVRSFDDPRLRIVQNECNLGLAENLNRGLSLVATETATTSPSLVGWNTKWLYSTPIPISASVAQDSSVSAPQRHRYAFPNGTKISWPTCCLSAASSSPLSA